MKITLAFVVALLTSFIITAPSYAAANKPYCSVASNAGAGWHVWSASSHQSGCYTAFFKVLKTGQSVDKALKGYYKPVGLNTAKINCTQGSKKVYGNGSQVFTNAINMKNQLGWKGCVIQVI